MTAGYDVFLSFCASQRDWVRGLARDLERRFQLRCFFDEWDVRPGTNLVLGLRDEE